MSHGFRALVLPGWRRVGLAVQGHEGAEQLGAEGLPAIPHGEDLDVADGQGAARLEHGADRAQTLAGGRRQQVDLELGGEHRSAGREQGVGRIAARRVGDGRGDAGVEEAVQQLTTRYAKIFDNVGKMTLIM